MGKLLSKAMASVSLAASLVRSVLFGESIKAPSFGYDLVCLDANGNERWREHIDNLVTTVGKTDLINQYFLGAGYTAAWYMGLKGVGAPDVADTLASHGSWTEETPYTGNRKAITFGTTTAGSNTATAINFAITATAVIAGAIITNVASGTSGLLYSAGDFANARSVFSGDALIVTATVAAT